jgi:hypothetical protein
MPAELSALLNPAAVTMVTMLVGLLVIVRKFEAGRKEMINLIADEVNRRNQPAAPTEVNLKQPFLVTPEDPPTTRSACATHAKHFERAISEVSVRVDRLERRWDDDIKRVHDRIDEIPARVISLLGETKALHAKEGK